MKKILYIFSIAILGVFLVQCDKEFDDIVTENAKIGGLIDVSSAAQNYVVGDGASYSFDLYLNQNADASIKTVNVYKSFSSVAVAWSVPADHTEADSIPAKTSNEVLQETFSVSNGESHWISVAAMDFTALTANLLVDGNALPASDGDLRIGDSFNFTVEAILNDGRTVTQAYEVKMAVSTRFAGTYTIVAGSYFRIGVDQGADFQVGETALIESVDAKTYVWSDWGVASGWDGNKLYFQVEDDGSITYPAEWNGVAQILNDQPLITCELNAQDLTNVGCGNSNFVVKDDVSGKDQLKLVHGYLTSGSGPREFEFILVKN